MQNKSCSNGWTRTHPKYWPRWVLVFAANRRVLDFGGLEHGCRPSIRLSALVCTKFWIAVLSGGCKPQSTPVFTAPRHSYSTTRVVSPEIYTGKFFQKFPEMYSYFFSRNFRKISRTILQEISDPITTNFPNNCAFAYKDPFQSFLQHV